MGRVGRLTLASAKRRHKHKPVRRPKQPSGWPARRHGGCGQAPFPASYLAAVTAFTAMVSPLAVPVTLACSPSQFVEFVQHGLILRVKGIDLVPDYQGVVSAFLHAGTTAICGGDISLRVLGPAH